MRRPSGRGRDASRAAEVETPAERPRSRSARSRSRLTPAERPRSRAGERRRVTAPRRAAQDPVNPSSTFAMRPREVAASESAAAERPRSRRQPSGRGRGSRQPSGRARPASGPRRRPITPPPAPLSQQRPPRAEVNRKCWRSNDRQRRDIRSKGVDEACTCRAGDYAEGARGVPAGFAHRGKGGGDMHGEGPRGGSRTTGGRGCEARHFTCAAKGIAGDMRGSMCRVAADALLAVRACVFFVWLHLGNCDDRARRACVWPPSFHFLPFLAPDLRLINALRARGRQKLISFPLPPERRPAWFQKFRRRASALPC